METGAANHMPVILEVAERQETQNGYLIIHKDITFTDPAGDAVTVVNKVVSAIQPAKVMDDMIQSSAEEQKGEAIITSSFGCFKQLNFEMQFRIYDKAGNMSEPVTTTFSCPALKNRISPSLITGLILGVGLFGAVGYLVRHHHSKTVRAARPEND